VDTAEDGTVIPEIGHGAILFSVFKSVLCRGRGEGEEAASTCGRRHESGEVLASFPDGQGEQWCVNCRGEGKRKGVYLRYVSHGDIGPDADTSPCPPQ
jgi:hypothetical protein